jgi:hypothetical protein
MYSILVASLVGLIIVMSIVWNTRMHNERVLAEIANIKTSQELENQFLMSRITYGEERQRKVLFLRDEILAFWETIPEEKRSKDRKYDLASAYDLASLNITVSEMFPNVDPFLVASLQKVESGWGVSILSPEGAKGLNQFMPSTARLICAAMGREYFPGIENDDKSSTEMAAKYLDIMFSEHRDWGISLADYNGGPYSAVYYKRKDSRLSAETKAYVPKVLSTFESLNTKFKTYKVQVSSLDPNQYKKEK